MWPRACAVSVCTAVCAVCVTRWNRRSATAPPVPRQPAGGQGARGQRRARRLGAAPEWRWGLAGLGRDAWQLARGVLGTGPRRKPAQQRRRRHSNAAQSAGLLTPRPRPARSLFQGVGEGLLQAAPQPLGAQCPGSLRPPPGLLPSHRDSVPSSINGGDGRTEMSSTQSVLSCISFLPVSCWALAPVVAKRLWEFPDQESLCCWSDCKP